MCATDAGREGELIFRYIYEAAQCGKPVSRLWISSLTPDAIRKGFDALRAGARLRRPGRRRARAQPRRLAGRDEPLARLLARPTARTSRWAACRRPRWPWWSSASWRSATSCPRTTWRCWRRSTRPVRRKRQHATRAPGSATADADGADKESLQQAMRLPPDGEEAKRIVARARTGQAAIESIEAADAAHAAAAALRPDRAAAPRQPPVRLQRAEDAGCRPGALRTPQADQLSAHRQPPPLAGRRRARCRGVVARSQAPYREHLAPGTGERPLGRRFVDDAKVTDHHAIIPTATSPANGVALARRAQDLRPGLPPPAQRLARGPHLVRDHGDHGDPQRRQSSTAITRPAARCSRSAGRCWTWRPPKAKKAPRERRRAAGRTGAAAGPRPGPAAGRARCRRPRRRRRAPPSASPKPPCSPPWRRRARRSTRRSSPTR